MTKILQGASENAILSAGSEGSVKVTKGYAMKKEKTLRFTEKEFVDTLNDFAGTSFVSDQDESDGLMLAASAESEWVDLEKAVNLDCRTPEHVRIENLIRTMISEKFGENMTGLYSDHAENVFITVE